MKSPTRRFKNYLRTQQKVIGTFLCISVRSWSEEDIHDARVAIRRLDTCCWLAKSALSRKDRFELKRLEKKISRFMTDIGEIRRWQVISHYARRSHLPLADLVRSEKKARRRVQRNWGPSRREQLRKRMYKTLPIVLDVPSNSLTKVIEHRHRKMGESYKAQMKKLPVSKADWHHLRLLTKKWRYALEARSLGKKILRGKMNRQIEKLSLLQNTVGELHDLETCRKELGRRFSVVGTQALLKKARQQFRGIGLDSL